MDSLRWLLLLIGTFAAVAEAAKARSQLKPGDAVKAAEDQLREAGEKDEAAHEKAGCFCEKNVAEKEQTVENMQQQITSLSHEIDETQAKIGQLDVEVNTHQEELGAATEALSTAEALRQKDAEKFDDDETSHTQSIDQLKAALDKIKTHHSVAAALIAVKSVTKRLRRNTSRHADLSFVQLRHSIRGAGSNSPAVVAGTIEHMITSFSRDLSDMRSEEADAKASHAALASAKSQEIAAQKKHLLEKKQRLAKNKVSVSSKAQIKERSQKLLDANMKLLGALKQLCKRRDEGFESRREDIQAQFVTLSAVQVDLAGASLLSVAAKSRGDGAEELCSVASEFREKAWRDQAQAGCKQARAGQKTQAAEAVEELQTDIREAQDEAARKQDDCTSAIRGASEEASVAAKEESAEASFVGSETASAEDQIQALQSQSDGADKAKEDFQQVLQVEKEAVQALRVATSRGDENLKAAASHAAGEAASARINEAIGQSDKLMAAAEEFASGSGDEARELPSLLDGVRIAAGKVMIPLRLMKADSEETAIAIKEEGDSRAHALKPKCDAAALSAEVARFKGYRYKLGKAAESLAWESLR